MNWTKEELLHFIEEASLNTYANPDAKTIPVPLRSGCDEFLYQSGDWKYHDSYAWKKDGGGEEIVYFKGEPIWVMNYYGYLIGKPDAKEIYRFLHVALQKRHATLPVRGDTYEESNLRYEVEYEKNSIENFHGVERIRQNEELVYECYVHGGFVR